MATTIRAVFLNGRFMPLEKVDFPEGREVKLTIDSLDMVHQPGEGLEASAGGWKMVVNGEQLKRDIDESRQIRTRPEVNL